MKLGRIFELHIEMNQNTQDTIIVRSPMTIRFTISRNVMASASTGTIEIYNLAESTRRRVYQDRFDVTTYRRVVLKAGYEGNMPIIFRGNLRMAQSARHGADIVTELDAFDAGYGIINGFSNRTWPAKTDTKQIIVDMMKDLPNVMAGKVGDFSGSSETRGYAVCGNTWNALNDIVGTDGNAFIDLETAHVLKHDECLKGDVAVISARTGLLKTPRRNDAVIEVQTIFEPRLQVGQIVQLDSQEKTYNGQYKVLGVQHTGVISESMGGACTTSVTMRIGTQSLQEVQ